MFHVHKIQDLGNKRKLFGGGGGEVHQGSKKSYGIMEMEPKSEGPHNAKTKNCKHLKLVL